MKPIIRLVFVSLFCSTTFSQSQNRTFINATTTTNNQLKIEVNDGNYTIQFYTPEIVETTFVPLHDTKNKKSHAVILQPQKVQTQFVQNSQEVQYSSKGITVKINKTPFKIRYYYQGEEIISEKEGYYKSKHEPLEMVAGNIETSTTEKISFSISADEILYGGGARALGMNRRGYRLPLFNRAHYGYETHSQLMNYTLPIVISSKKYLIHFDNAPIGYLDLDSKKNNTLTYETISGRKTYQVVVGKSWLQLIDNYTQLTGKQPLPPRWAFGNFSSRFGYHSQKEAEATIAKFKADTIPVDAIILDLYWFGKDIKGTMGNLEVYQDSFPNLKQMIANFNKQDVKTILITEPFILTTSKKWEEAVSKKILATDSVGNPARYDFYFGNTGLIDIYKKEGENWFWNIYKELANIGVAGVWGDLGEPEVHPNWVQHATGSAAEVHNSYGHDWARLIYEGYQRDFPNKRPFILMRAGYSGSQRYGMIPWSGDVNRSWGGLQSQTEIALQMSMQGLAYMHSDLGGFAGDNLDNELYVRWLQYGVFQPIYRPHAQEQVASEPVFKEEKTKALAKKAIELRYQLLPYNYTLAFLNSTKGYPLMRPLFFEEPNNTKLKTVATSYLWGNDFLVTPITAAGVTEQEIYFPKSANWFDFYSNKKYEAGTTINYKVTEKNIPTFVRGGAFIPLSKIESSTAQFNPNQFNLHYYFDTKTKESTATLYIDDGKTPNAYQKGDFEMLHFSSKVGKNKLELEFNSEKGKNYNKKTPKEIKMVIQNYTQAPKCIKVNGKKIPFNWEASKKTISFIVKWNANKAIKIKIK